MKRALRTIAAILLIAVFAVFALASGESETKTQESGSAEASESTVSKNEEIGDYAVVIDSCRIAKAKGFQDKDAVIVKYVFTNVNDDNPASFSLAFDDEVYQNGVGLNKAWLLDDSAKYSSDNQTKQIKKGASIEVEVAYELNDSTTDIEVEVKELFSFNDTTLTKTFSIKSE